MEKLMPQMSNSQMEKYLKLELHLNFACLPVGRDFDI
jgi:hypothetical protein